MNEVYTDLEMDENSNYKNKRLCKFKGTLKKSQLKSKLSDKNGNFTFLFHYFGEERESVHYMVEFHLEVGQISEAFDPNEWEEFNISSQTH